MTIMGNSLASISRKNVIVPVNVHQILTLKDLTIEKLESIEKELAEEKGDNTIITNNFLNGTFVRECFIPAGTFIIGAIHKTAHMSIMAYGHLLLWDSSSGKAVEVRGYHRSESPPGTKRVAYAFEDTMYITCHKAEKVLTEESEIRKAYTYENYRSFLLENPSVQLLCKP